MKLDYSWMPGSFALVDSTLLEECAALYSSHYGRWGSRSPAAGRRVRLSAKRLREWLDSPDSRITLARSGSDLVGYAIAVQAKANQCGIVSWVTQLVVHEEYRRQDVAKTLLFSIWGSSDHFAWGLLTANPYAVRALEKATRRRCVPARIQKNSRRLHRIGLAHVPYVDERTDVDVRADQSRIRTNFFIDPEFYMLDEDSNVVYRREQFTAGRDLPAELIVRDRRFSRDEIEAMCAESGLDVVWTRFVRAGRWDDPLDEHDDRAKEILLLCRARP